MHYSDAGEERAPQFLAVARAVIGVANLFLCGLAGALRPYRFTAIPPALVRAGFVLKMSADRTESTS
jgi:hypothetical protein